MAAKPPSFSNESRIVKKMHLPNSTLLKDYLLDDLSSCSSNGFRSYPRRQCCTKIRYLIEIDLNKHIKLPQKKSHSKAKSKMHKASQVVTNVFKSLQFSGNGTKPNFLIRNLSRKLSNRGFWKRSNEKLKSFDVIPIVASNDSNSSDSTSSNFTMTSNSSTEVNVVQNDVVESKQVLILAQNEKKERKNEEKDQFSPVSVMDFPSGNDEDEVTSPFKRSHVYVKGSKRKLGSKVKRTKCLAQLKPVRLEDRITMSESRTNDSILESSLEENQTEKKANALLQLLKTTLPSHDLSESTISVLLGFFTEQLNDGNVSNYDVLQEAKDWINDQPREMFETENYKLAYIRDMEKRGKWSKYNGELEKDEVSLELEYEVFTSLVEEMLLDFYL